MGPQETEVAHERQLHTLNGRPDRLQPLSSALLADDATRVLEGPAAASLDLDCDLPRTVSSGGHPAAYLAGVDSRPAAAVLGRPGLPGRLPTASQAID